MKNKNTKKASVKSKAVKVTSKKKLTAKAYKERERMTYSFDKKTFSILATFTNHVKKVFTCKITKADVLTLIPLARKESNETFYAHCNKNLHLLDTLHCSSKHKGTDCTNTQYDSRKKLQKLLLHIALTELKQKAKSNKKSTKKARQTASVKS